MSEYIEDEIQLLNQKVDMLLDLSLETCKECRATGWKNHGLCHNCKGMGYVKE